MDAQCAVVRRAARLSGHQHNGCARDRAGKEIEIHARSRDSQATLLYTV